MRSVIKGLVGAVLLLAAAASSPADEASDIAAIATRHAALGKAYDDQDAAAVRALLTPDQRSATFAYDGPLDVDQQLASLAQLDVEVYDALTPSYAMLGADAALVTYEQSYRGTYKGNPLPGRVFVGEIWVRSGDAWLQKFYQETVIEVEE